MNSIPVNTYPNFMLKEKIPAQCVKIILLLSFIIISFSNSIAQTDNNAIYNLALETCTVQPYNGDIVLADRTTSYFQYNSAGAGIASHDYYDHFGQPAEGMSFWTQFCNANKSTSAVRDIFPASSRFRLITLPTDSTNGTIPWRTAEAQLAGLDRYYMLSRIVYSNDGSLAMVCIEEHCGDTCGKGQILLLKKTATWSIIFKAVLWKA